MVPDRRAAGQSARTQDLKTINHLMRRNEGSKGDFDLLLGPACSSPEPRQARHQIRSQCEQSKANIREKVQCSPFPAAGHSSGR